MPDVLPTVKCPTCRHQLPEIAWNTQAPMPMWREGPPGAFITFFCPHCQGVLGCQMVPISVAAAPTGAPRVATGMPRLG